MKMILTAVLAVCVALAMPSAGLADSTLRVAITRADAVRVVSVNRVGGAVDGPRASAYAGTQVYPVSWVGRDNPGLRDALDRKQLTTSAVKAVYGDGNGNFWAFVDLSKRILPRPFGLRMFPR
jgi:hypothetical protein